MQNGFHCFARRQAQYCLTFFSELLEAVNLFIGDQ
jgi:hypothetical protein